VIQLIVVHSFDLESQARTAHLAATTGILELPIGGRCRLVDKVLTNRKIYPLRNTSSAQNRRRADARVLEDGCAFNREQILGI
jgi:hypothetical protein